MSDVIGALWVTLGLDASSLEKGMGQAQGSLTKWRDETNQNTMEMAKWGAAIAAQIAPFVAVGYAALDAAHAAAAHGDRLEDLSLTTTMTEHTLQRLKYAVDASGGNFDAAAGAVGVLARTLQNAVDPTSKQAEAFERLGISVVRANGEVEDMDTVLPQVIDKLHNMDNKTERLALTTALFGRNTLEVSKMIELGSKGLAEYGDEAERLGLILSEEELARQQEFQAAWAEANTQLQMMYIQLGTEIIPIIQEVIPVVESVLPVVESLIDVVGVLTSGFIALAEAAMAAQSAVQGVVSGDFSDAQDHLSASYDAATRSGESAKDLVGAKTTATPAEAKKGTAISKSKALYAERHGGVTQNVNINAVQQTPDQINTIIKAASRSFGSGFMGLL